MNKKLNLIFDISVLDKMKSIVRLAILKLMLLPSLLMVNCDKLQDLFANCRISSPDFEECLKFALNQLNPLFKYGLPDYNVAPFDPHRQSFVEQTRGDLGGLGGFKLILKDVSEYGWTQSWITKLK